MPTRSFILDAAEKRFWDISWEGPEVEISSGKWGSNGRARAQTFESVAERDRFIASEIAKIAKKGYREVNEVAPAAEAAPAAIEKKVTSLRSRVAARAQPAWLPAFAPGVEGDGIVRGPMTLDRDEAWPSCPSCARPLSGLFELDLARVPAKHLQSDGLVQLFWCEAFDRNEIEDVCSVSHGWIARRHGRGTRRDHPVTRQRGRGPFAIVGWARHEEAPPHAGELEALFEAADEEVIAALVRGEADEDPYSIVVRGLGLEPKNEHKLAGWPTFVQSYEGEHRQIFQIEMKAPFDVNFGDIGAGHLLELPNGAIDFYWSCH